MHLSAAAYSGSPRFSICVQRRISGVLLAMAAALGAGVGLPQSAYAQSSQYVAWGTASTASSPDNHMDDSTIAVIAAKGRESILPGASVTAIGVMNKINVVGDNNILTSDQDGTNRGNVNSNVSVTKK